MTRPATERSAAEWRPAEYWAGAKLTLRTPEFAGIEWTDGALA